jgi:hypothetical protein
MVDPGGAGILQPAELEALARVFEPARSWLEGLAADPEQRAALEAERAAARRLAQALGAAQERAWTGAAAALEGLLAEFPDGLLVGLLSDGSDWRAAPGLPAAPR